MSILKSLFGGKAPSPATSPLMAALQNYPPNSPPFPGLRKSLKPAQLDANLDHLITSCDIRISHLRALLMKFGVDAGPLLDPVQSPQSASDAINVWLVKSLPGRTAMPPSDGPNAPYTLFQNSDRSGAEILFTLVADLALLEGEAIRRRDPRFFWAINRERVLAGKETAKRPCLMRAPTPFWRIPLDFDLEQGMLAIVYQMRDGTGTHHQFGEQLAGVLRGAVDPDRQ
jgi:hypothetical protein